MRSVKYVAFILTLAIAAGCNKDQASVNTNSSSNGSPQGTTGQGGSLARFTIAQGHLYVVDDLKLHTYSLANPAAPKLTSTTIIGEDIETIYSFKDKLFIGSQNAMYIYSISNASHPDKIGTASHVRACDPVVADDTVAYVTVRSGTGCGGSNNALFVYDVKNVLTPKQRNVINMQSPWGLGMGGNWLYVCNGSAGLSVYDISNRYYPSFKQRITDETYHDVIVYGNLLICMVEGGTLLYEIKPGGNLVKMGKIYS